MSDRDQTGDYGDQLPDLTEKYPPLPGWLARRVLGEDEKILWVVGPWFKPSWERYVTHPLLFIVAVVLGAICLTAGRIYAGSWSELPIPFALAALVLVFGSIFILAIYSAYFTRLVVTDSRLVILQGREVCSSWKIDDLPVSLIQYGMMGAGREHRSIDLNAVKSMLGGASDKFADANTILSFGKHLDRIKTRKNDRTERDRDT